MMHSQNIWRSGSMLLFLLLGLAPTTQTLAGACDVLKAIAAQLEVIQISELKQDVAVELELSMSKELMALVTTDTGRLDAFHLQSYPQAIIDWAAKRHPQVADLGTLPWDTLPVKLQVALLEHMGIEKKPVFWKNRGVPGLRYKDQLTLTFTKTIELFGRSFGPGTHTIQNDFLVGRPEYKSQRAVTDLNGFEIHVRLQGRAGTTSRDARRLQEALGLDKTSQHVHIPHRLDLAWLRASSETRPFMMAGFIGMVNRLAEMTSLLSGNSGIKQRRTADDQNVLFDHLIASRHKKNFEYFQDLISSSDKLISPGRLEIAYVELRRAGTYDDPNLIGLEYRAVSKRMPAKLSERLLDAIQAAMDEHAFGLTDQQILAWKATVFEGDSTQTARLVRTWPHHADPAHFSGEDFFEVVNYKRGNSRWNRIQDDAQLAPIFESQYLKHRELDWLIFDWKLDPYFHGDRDALELIARQQERSLKRLADGEKVVEVMRDFILDSRILEHDLRSLRLIAGELDLPRDPPHSDGELGS